MVVAMVPDAAPGSWAHLVALALAGLIGWGAIVLHKIKYPAPPPGESGPETPPPAKSRGSRGAPRGDVDLDETGDEDGEGRWVTFRKRARAVVTTGSDRLPGDGGETRIEAADRLNEAIEMGEITAAAAVRELMASHRLSHPIAKRYIQLAYKRVIEAGADEDESDEED